MVDVVVFAFVTVVCVSVLDLVLLLLCVCVVFFFKQKTAYEMRISDWSSDVCSSDLGPRRGLDLHELLGSEDEGHLVGEAAEPVDAVHQRGDLRVGAEIGRASCRARVCQYV